MRHNTEKVWQFNTKHFSVRLEITRNPHYRYDGNDEDGETQYKLDTGEYIAFDSAVIIEKDGKEIAADYLGESVYAWHNIHEFWIAHRDKDPMNRNCSMMREAKGGNVCICHYFPDMVRTAIANVPLKFR